MTSNDYTPKQYKELVERLLEENHNISQNGTLPTSFYSSAKGVEVLSNFDSVFSAFVQEFPLSSKMSQEHLKLTFKILLQQQLDSYWYSGFKSYKTNLEIYNDRDLVCFTDEEPNFQYLQVDPKKGRVPLIEKVILAITNSELRYTSGLLLPYAPYPMYNFLNSLSERLGFKVIVSGVVRSVEYQNQLIQRGVIASNASSHIHGYTVDLDQKWFKLNSPSKHRAIEDILNKLEVKGEVNYIDFGNIWHVCLSPCYLHKYLN